ncbi:unnamed protein product [Rotaria sordida]|uniref:Enoyl reductase (ER) domain-containing protein n=1 Tax=Rotaria sordida TaxID=392033 RepID=A0A814W2H8_9BILA|nr:unnamed protein product [Rotaria sordida]
MSLEQEIPIKQKCLQWIKVGDKPFQFTDSALVTQPKDLEQNDVLIQVYSAGVNPIDGKMAAENIAQVKLPAVVGYDVSGTIVGIGSSVKDFKIGDDVLGCLTFKRGGGFQQYCVTDESVLIKKSPGVSHEQAASLGVAYLSALDGLQHVRNQIQGKSVFVPGGSGAGHFIVQICKILGASPLIASASKEEGIKLLKETYHCDHVINHAKEDVVAKIQEITVGQGAHIVFDSTYISSSFEKSIRSTANGGSWIVLGKFVQEGSVEEQMCQQQNVKLIHADLGKYSAKSEFEAKRSEFFRQGLKEACEWILQGKLKPYINQQPTIEELETAIEKLRKGQSGFGKVVAKIH